MHVVQIIASFMISFGLQCGPGVTPLQGVDAPLPYLVPEAAKSFQHIRVHVRDVTGIDALATLADALRWPGYTSTKAGVAFRSWHKAGLAIDLDTRLNWKVVPDGRYYRLFLRGVDVTQIFLDHGWRRIPAVDDVPEWWHFQFTAPGMDWEAAMAHTWPYGNQVVQATCEPVTSEIPVALDTALDKGGNDLIARQFPLFHPIQLYRGMRAE